MKFLENGDVIYSQEEHELAQHGLKYIQLLLENKTEEDSQ